MLTAYPPSHIPHSLYGSVHKNYLSKLSFLILRRSSSYIVAGLPIIIKKMSSLGSNTTAAAFIGASVTLVLVIIFMVLMVILVRQCLAFMAKRNSIRQQIEQHRHQRQELERQRRLSVTEPVNPTFDWHHSIRIAGTPPPSYHEAKKLPTFDDSTEVKAESLEEKNTIDIKRDSGEVSGNSIQIVDNISDTNIPHANDNDNDQGPHTDNRTASMANIPSETIITVESETSASDHNLHMTEDTSNAVPPV